MFCQCKVCGFRRHVRFADLRSKNTICNNCFDNKLRSDANINGLTLIGYSEKGPASRLFKIDSCGHLMSIRTDDARNGRYWCRQCFIERTCREADELGYVVLDTDENLTYSFTAKCKTCGNVEVKKADRISRCSNCMVISWKENAIKQGCEFIRHSSPSRSIYRLQCGHEQEIPDAKMRDGIFRCKICHETMLVKDAEACGAKIHLDDHRMVGTSSKYAYTLKCGCRQYVRRDSVLRGRIYCEKCDDVFYKEPNSIYLLKVHREDDSWLKLGVSFDIERRKEEYGLGDVEIVLLKTVSFPTGFAAIKEEKKLHKSLKEHNLDWDSMRSKMKSGFTECYSVDAEHLILDLLDKFNRHKDKESSIE